MCGLKSVEIPRSVTKIGARAFADCGALAEVSFQEKSALSTVGKDAFAGLFCRKVNLPAGVKVVSDSEMDYE